MRKIHILIALVSLYALAAVPVAAQIAVPPEAHQWEVPHANGVSYGVDYMLHNQKNKKQIGYEKTAGPEVDLDWVGNFGGLFSFNRKAPAGTRDHRTGPIPENADVAIYNTETRRYLTYKKFDDTIAELEWTSTPTYEWQIRDQKGTSVASFALFNSRVRKYLVLQGKTRGISLGWLNDRPTGPQSFSLALSAQPVTQGWIPYRGSFGAYMRGKLLTVQNASGSATLLFVRPGQSTSSCGEPRDSVRVAPRAAMTAAQMKTLYGLETPRLPITFLACLASATSQSIGLTHLNITYQLDQ